MVWESVPTQVSGVGLEDTVDDAREDDPRQVFDVDLMDYAGAWGHHLEVVEGSLSPPQELVALTVPAVFDVSVLPEGGRGAEHLRDHGVVDDHLSWGERVHAGRIAAQHLDCLAHGGQVHHAGDACEVLHDDSGWGELDLVAGLGLGIPAPKRTDVVGCDIRAVLRAQQVLKQDLETVWQPLVPFNGIDPEYLVAVAPHVEEGPGPEAVYAHRFSLLASRCDILTSDITATPAAKIPQA